MSNKKHQIALIGGAVHPIYYAVKKYAPDEVHFIVTEQSKGGVDILKRLLEPGIKCSADFVDAYNPDNIKEVLEKKCNELTNCSFHVTGGTKLMSIVAVAVAREHAIPVFYYAGANKWIHINKGEFTTEVSAVTLDNSEIISLSDQSVKSSLKYSEIKPEDIECARKISEFRILNKGIYNSMMRYIAKNKISSVGKYGLTFGDFGISLRYDSNNSLQLSKEKIEIMTLESLMAEDLLLRAGWWELIVAEALHKWSPERELWVNTKFALKKDTNIDKNEVDIIVNIGQNMLFVECKSGEVKQTDIYKIEAVRKTYGDDKSHSLLVSFYNPGKDIIEKCNDSKIDVLFPRFDETGIDMLKRIPKSMDEILKKIRI